MSDTPRVDMAWTASERDDDHGAIAMHGLAQELERELAAVTAERRGLRDVLTRHGFRECDIPACNCGSWHHVDGLAARWRDIKEALEEAGVLDNSTGNMPLRAIEKLAAERDALLEIKDAAQNLIDVKGRHNTAIAYGRLAMALQRP